GRRDGVPLEDGHRGRVEVRVPVVEGDRDRLPRDGSSSRDPCRDGREWDESVPARGQCAEVAIEGGRWDGRLDGSIADGVVGEDGDLLEAAEGVEQIAGRVAAGERHLLQHLPSAPHTAAWYA